MSSASTRPDHVEPSEDSKTADTVQESLDRYLDCFDPGEATITRFDPTIFLAKLQDNIKDWELFVCNREPFCGHLSPEDCDCDEDEFGPVTMEVEMVSNCKCNIILTIDQVVPLAKDFVWRVFRFASEQTGSAEIPILDINPIDNRVLIYDAEEVSVEFDLEDPAKFKNRRVILQFDYMLWRGDGRQSPASQTDFEPVD